MSIETIPSRGTDLLAFFSGISSSAVSVEVDAHGLSAYASFESGGRARWTASLWLDGSVVEGFILRDEDSGVELVVRDLVRSAGDPLVAWLVPAVCRVAGLSSSAGS